MKKEINEKNTGADNLGSVRLKSAVASTKELLDSVDKKMAGLKDSMASGDEDKFKNFKKEVLDLVEKISSQMGGKK